MRKLPPPPRKLRPRIDSLENLAPVSILIPGLAAQVPASSPALVDEGGSVPDSRLTTGMEGRPSSAISTLPDRPVALSDGGASNDQGGWQTDPSAPILAALATTRGPESTGSAFDSLISIVTPAESSANPSPSLAPSAPALAASQPQTARNLPTPNPVPVASNQGTPPTQPASPSKGAFGMGIIRPMSMAPGVAARSALSARASHADTAILGHSGAKALGTGTQMSPMASGSGVGGGSNSGSYSGGTPPDKPPSLQFTGFTAQLTSKPGVDPATYQATGEVPIGTIVKIQASGGGSNYIPSSYTWENGTVYSAYTSAAANQIAPASVSVVKNVATDAPSYQFIVDSSPRQYNIVIDVGYKNGAFGKATVTFTSDAPTGSLSTGLSQPFVTTAVTGNSNQSITMSVGNQNTNNPSVMIMYINASTDSYTAGNFMLLQIVNSTYRSYTDANGVPYHSANDSSFPGFDGPLQDGQQLGYPIVFGPQPTPWTYPLPSTLSVGTSMSIPKKSSLPALGKAPAWTFDSPSKTVPINYQSLNMDESFSDYLMYMPATSGVWIALSQLNWSYNVTAKNTGGVWQVQGGGVNQPVTITGPTTPTGDSAFPNWVNTTPVFLKQGYKQGF